MRRSFGWFCAQNEDKGIGTVYHQVDLPVSQLTHSRQPNSLPKLYFNYLQLLFSNSNFQRLSFRNRSFFLFKFGINDPLELVVWLEMCILEYLSAKSKYCQWNKCLWEWPMSERGRKTAKRGEGAREWDRVNSYPSPLWHSPKPMDRHLPFSHRSMSANSALLFSPVLIVLFFLETHFKFRTIRPSDLVFGNYSYFNRRISSVAHSTTMIAVAIILLVFFLTSGKLVMAKVRGKHYECRVVRS